MKDAIQHLKEQHPYPEDVFVPIPKEEWPGIEVLLEEYGYSQTQIFGHMARVGYESAIAKLEEL